jgi:hypothetical protein
MKYTFITLMIAVAVVVIIGFRRALRVYLRFRGKRLVSCPETHQPAAVRVAAGKAALDATVGPLDCLSMPSTKLVQLL